MEVNSNDVIAAGAAIFAALASVFTFTIKAWVSARGSESAAVTLNVLTQQLAKDVEKLVQAEDDFQRKGWGTLPDDLSSSSGLTSTIREMQNDMECLKNVQKDVLSRLLVVQTALRDSAGKD